MNKQILVIGDLHGRTNWKDRICLSFDKIIFLGDYVDSFDISDKQIIDNLEELIKFKKENPDKVELLLGNHDLMYYFIPNNRLWMCSGYRASYADELYRLFNQNRKLFKACHQESNWFFSHAGLSKLFLKSLQKRIPKNIIDIENCDYATYINDIFNTIPNYLSDISHYRGGIGNWGGIFWADIREFNEDSYIPNLNQICGHQPIKNIEIKEFGKEKTKMIWIDTESTSNPIELSIYKLEV